jgi:hypothetical protein
MKNTSGIDEISYKADLWPAFNFGDYSQGVALG